MEDGLIKGGTEQKHENEGDNAVEAIFDLA